MTPTGEGANLAMYDGAELGQAIVAHRDDLDSALAEYEESMFARSANAAAESARLNKLLLDDNAPQGLLDFFAGAEKNR
jgi:2-polyprenyl-6-methoxyphenol hydroxylase-like FAD-dependent oxidoreductase